MRDPESRTSCVHEGFRECCTFLRETVRQLPIYLNIGVSGSPTECLMKLHKTSRRQPTLVQFCRAVSVWKGSQDDTSLGLVPLCMITNSPSPSPVHIRLSRWRRHVSRRTCRLPTVCSGGFIVVLCLVFGVFAKGPVIVL